jgi:hypothetical protein
VQIYQNDVTDTSVEDAHSAERRAQIDADRGGFGRRSMTQQHAENRRDGDERDYERGGAQIPVAHRSMTSASTKLYDAAQDANNADHIFAEHTLSVDEARTRAAVLLKDAPATTPPPPSKAPFAVSTAFTSTPTSKLAEMQRAAPPQFTNVVGSVRLADGPGDARGALQLRLEVKMIRAEHLLARTLVVPDSLSLAQLHDRVLMPAFGMPRRTPPVGFFFAPTADLMAANNGALLDTETDPATAAYMHFPLAIGNARFLTNADYALFGIKQLLIANKTALRNLDLAPGSEFAWVVAPSDAGYIFSVRVLAVLRGAARLPAPISLESGKGGAVLYLPPPPSTTLLARMAANLFPAGAAFTTVVSGLAKAGAALAVVVGGTESLMGAQLESDELVKHGLYQPFVLAFWKRHLLLHVMCTYSTDPEDEFVDAKLPLALRSTRVPYVPAPNVCQNCHAPAQLMCAGCEIVWFCTTACQHEQWALHSQFCCQLVELAAADIVPDSKVAGRVVSYAIRTQVFWVKNGSSKPEPVRIDIAKWNKQRLQQEEQQNGKNNKSGGNNNNNNNNKQKK